MDGPGGGDARAKKKKAGQAETQGVIGRARLSSLNNKKTTTTTTKKEKKQGEKKKDQKRFGRSRAATAIY